MGRLCTNSVIRKIKSVHAAFEDSNTIGKTAREQGDRIKKGKFLNQEFVEI